MDWLVVSLLNGVVYGLLLFMVASGLTLVFGMMGVINFAHASFYMLGAYFAFLVGQAGGYWAGLVLGPLLVVVISYFVERYLLRPVHKYGHTGELLLTFGLAAFFDECVKLVFGQFMINYTVPRAFVFSLFSIGNVGYPFYRVFVAVIAIVLLAILVVLLHYTRLGVLVRAAVQRPDMVSALGHDVNRLFMVTFCVGAWMAGIAGAVGGALLTTSPTMGQEMLLMTFVVIIVGGLGSLAGAFMASILVGILVTFSVFVDVSLLDIGRALGFGEALAALGSFAKVKLSVYASSMPTLFMLVVLLVRPAGIMGARS